jgi:cysteine-rich repeat protein
MRLVHSMSAMLTVAALAAVSGCNQTTKQDSVGDNKSVGAIAAKLTLPDDSEIDAVSFSITGPGYSRTGSVPTNNSTVLTFRIGGVPVQAGYNIQLDADTQFGNHCTGSTSFDVLNNQTTLISVILNCGATDNDGDVLVNGAFVSCPVIASITAIPGEVTLGNSISLDSTISHGTNPVEWTGAGGTFATPNDYDTTFTCDVAGPHTLTVAVDAVGCSDARTVDVVCTLGAACGNGQLDPGEQCDDGNADNTDSCTTQCQNAVCGDGFVLAGTETCDDDNNLTEECAYGLASCSVCNSTCQDVAGEVDVCGDGTVDSAETCDDSNTTTEECAYGLASCSVCNSACQTGAGVTHLCGDGVVDAPDEQCDGGAGCNSSCQTVVDNCTPCRNANCVDYQGINWVAGCFDSSATGDTARAAAGAVFSPAQVQACVDAMACASANDCGRTFGSIANDCYCGAFDATFALDDCIASGPKGGVDAACSEQWRVATEQTSPANVLGDISAIALPAGWAYFLLECEASFCSSVCP